MIVWGGRAGSGYLATGGRYNPASNTWSPTSLNDPPSGRIDATAIWTGSRMIVWGGRTENSQVFSTGGIYDPFKDAWQHTSALNPPSARRDHTAVWTGDQMIVWGGINSASPGIGGTLNTGARYDVAQDVWTPTGIGTAPSPRALHTLTWTGTHAIVLGGAGQGVVPATGLLNTGSRYDPVTDSWAATTLVGAPSARQTHTAVWTGSRLIIWGGGPFPLNSGTLYDPVADSWTATSLIAAPAGRQVHTAVWTGSEMVVWGGYANSGSALLQTGGRYDPNTDTWNATSTGANVPAARADHTALWTGSEMIMWGGRSASGNESTGARYSPASNGWTPVETTGAPTARVFHTAVWTGSQMLVWGGIGPVSTAAGARYEPTSNTWTPISTTASPVARQRHTAVWTGERMVVWGGEPLEGCCYLDTGGRYDPAGDSWVATSTVGAPEETSSHAAVWSGSEMIVWGGRTINEPATQRGGRYAVVLAAIDGDGDGLADACDDCPADPDNDIDLDGICGNVDNCPDLANGSQQDLDGDAVGDGCDNCPVTANGPQSDLDADMVGDLCDLDDGWIFVHFGSEVDLEWQAEAGFDSWNVYRGDLAVLRATGVYTQAPGSNALADRACGLASPALVDGVTPAANAVAFWLVTGNGVGGESSLGLASDGSPRPNTDPCP